MKTMLPLFRSVAWAALFAGASLYMIGTEGLTRRFAIWSIPPVSGAVESFTQAVSRPQDAIGAARSVDLGYVMRCSSIAVSRHDRLIAVAENDPGAVALISFKFGRLLARFPMRRVSCVAFSPLGNCVAVAGSRNRLLPVDGGHFGKAIALDAKSRRLKSPEQIGTLGSRTEGKCVCFLGSGGRIALASEHNIAIYGVPKTLHIKGRRSGPGLRPRPLRFLGSASFGFASNLVATRGGRFFAANSNWVVCLAGAPLRTLWQQRQVRGTQLAVAASPSGMEVICVGYRSDPVDQESWAFNPFASALLAGWRGRVWIRDGASGGISRTMKSRSRFISAAYDPVAHEAAIGLSLDSRLGGSSVILLRTRNGRRKATLQLPVWAELTGAMCFTADGRYVVVACRYGKLGVSAAGTKLLLWRVR